jgi:hypothetical protein
MKILKSLLFTIIFLAACAAEGKTMSGIKEDNFNLDDIIAGVEKISRSTVLVGPSAKDKNSKILVIASANEYGATITSKKAIAKLWHMMVEAEMLDAKELPLAVWMKVKKEIKIPERSFMRSTADDPETIDYIVSRAQFALDNFIFGKATADSVLETIGTALISKIRLKLRSNIQPENHPFTKARKGYGKNTLNDEGTLQRSIQLEVIGA